MGDLVVGNYDTVLVTGNAFIYNRIANTWKNLNPGGTQSVTAYGIWQNGGSDSTSYTIAGGQGNLGPGVLDESYLVDYDSATGQLTNYRVFHYKDQPKSAALSHFDGITLAPGGKGYNLTGFVTTGETVKGFFATVPRNPNGSFGAAKWTDVFYPGGKLTTGNTIVENKVLGISVNGGTQSYIATVAPDTAGIVVGVAKSGTRATFTITNTGNTTATFRLGAHTQVKSDRSGPKQSGSGKARYKISYTLNGAGATKPIENGSATATLGAGGSVQVVEENQSQRQACLQAHGQDHAHRQQHECIGDRERTGQNRAEGEISQPSAKLAAASGRFAPRRLRARPCCFAG